jgi:hypothetical protein
MRWNLSAIAVIVLAAGLWAWNTIAFQRQPLTTIALPYEVAQNRIAYFEREALIVGAAVVALLVIAFLRAGKR